MADACNGYQKSPTVPSKRSAWHEPAPDRERRGFLAVVFGSFLALGFAALGVVGGLWTVVCGRFMFPNTLTQPPTKFRAGLPGNYPPGHVETRFKQRYGVLLVNGKYRGKRQIFALSSACTHLGCVVVWQERQQQFRCPCHGSGFNTDGINFEGPAPRPLDRFAIRITDDGYLEVDKSKIFQEELGQWDDPACYVRA